MSLQDYNASASDATGLSRTFPQMKEPDFSAHNEKFRTAKYVIKPIQDEILKLIQSVYATGITQRTGRKNRVINGSFAVAQRGTTFTSVAPLNSDDTYTLDRWYMLTDGNDVFDVTQQLASDEYECRLDVETVNKKGGIAQIIEYKDCQQLIGQTVTLSFKMKVSSTTKLDNIKAAIVAWSGTADTVTSDIISAWGVEGTNPTLIANATYENTPANLVPTTSYATYSVSGAIDTASAKNIILFIWSDVTDTTLGDFIHIKNVQLEPGATATTFEFQPFQQELALCQRYCWVFEKGSNLDGDNVLGFGTTVTNAISRCFIQPPVVMRTTPAMIATANEWNGFDGATGAILSTFAIIGAPTSSPSRFYVQADQGGTTWSATPGRCLILRGSTNNASGKVIFDAEL